MKMTSTDFPSTAIKYSLSPLKIIQLAIVVCCIYGGGIVMAVVAGKQTVTIAHQGCDIPFLYWGWAFFLIISGMLSLIYAVFFRAREIKLSENEVGIFLWNGEGKGFPLNQIKSVESRGGKIVLSSENEKIIFPPIFDAMPSLFEKLKSATKS